MAMNRGCRPLIFAPFALAFGICSACGGLSPPREQRNGAQGRFEFRAAEDPSKGFVIGVPRGGSEPGAVEYAQSMRDRLAAALVVAYDSDTPRTTAAATLTQPSSKRSMPIRRSITRDPRNTRRS